ncbi:MAG: prephenate dehydrogenase/arogenate dehydrogenase family protein [Syntrophomonadaceae bacterium]|jgi:prephenate dehydrogenase|nr:prephenate dehydrogenase [Bacillota bacterium]
MSITVAIIGTGLIGGSLGLAWHELPQVSTIIGIDNDEESLHKALQMGAIDEMTSLENGVERADVVFLCTPLQTFPGIIAQVAQHVRPGTLVTDVGSTKQKVMEWLGCLPDGVHFIGGHPMAGSEIQGIQGADRYLLENAVYILTPGPTVPPETLELLIELLAATGAKIKIMEPAQHDKMVASVSHLPHLAAVSLVNLTEGQPDLLMLAAGGFRDTTRVASSSPGLWKDILITNRSAVVQGLDKFMAQLARLRAALEKGDQEMLMEDLTQAQTIRAQIPHGQKGLMPTMCDVICIVPDRPGIIGELGRILGNHDINIADIEILRVREGDGGTIRLGVSDLPDGQRAVQALQDASIKAWIR